MKTQFDIFGYTKIFKNKDLVWEGPNAIQPFLRAYLADSISDSGQALKAIQGANLFSGGQPGSGDRGKAANDVSLNNRHGIIVSSTIGTSKSNYFAMHTTEISTEAANTYGAKWRGTITAGESGKAIPAPITLAAAIIGFNVGNSSSTQVPFFEVAYALQNFQAVTLAETDSLTIEWEIFIQ